jgi:hypothetical protein
MKRFSRFALLLASLVASPLVATAADTPRRPPNAEVIDEIDLPKLPNGKTKDDFNRDLQVTTKKTDDETITEYRLKGKLYKMVVKPNNGAASYTLVDDKGEGKFVRAGEAGTKITVPMWVILTW